MFNTISEKLNEDAMNMLSKIDGVCVSLRLFLDRSGC